MNPSSLAGHALELIEILRSDQRPADQIIDHFFRRRRYLGSHDRRELAETAYGILRNLRFLQTLVASVQPSAVDVPAWLFAAYKLRVEKQPQQAIESYNLTVPHADLARLATLDAAALTGAEVGVRLSFPDWFVAALRRQMVEAEAVRLLEALNQPPPLSIRVNTLQATREQCRRELQDSGLESHPTKYSPDGLVLANRSNLFGLEIFREGWFELQDEGSQLISLLVDPKPTWRVADVCAGGGGKSLHLAALMRNRGEVFSFDLILRRLENLQKRARRSGIHNIRTQVLKEGEVPTRHMGQMDAVLVDAPCSGTGVLRRNPDAKWKISPAQVQEMAVKQKAILDCYAPLLKPGGRLVYATCSLLAEENEEVVEAFLASHPDFQRAGAGDILQRYGLAQLASGSEMRLFPHVHGCDGFFAALLERMPASTAATNEAK